MPLTSQSEYSEKPGTTFAVPWIVGIQQPVTCRILRDRGSGTESHVHTAWRWKVDVAIFKFHCVEMCNKMVNIGPISPYHHGVVLPCEAGMQQPEASGWSRAEVKRR